MRLEKGRKFSNTVPVEMTGTSLNRASILGSDSLNVPTLDPRIITHLPESFTTRTYEQFNGVLPSNCVQICVHTNDKGHRPTSQMPLNYAKKHINKCVVSLNSMECHNHNMGKSTNGCISGGKWQSNRKGVSTGCNLTLGIICRLTQR